MIATMKNCCRRDSETTIVLKNKKSDALMIFRILVPWNLCSQYKIILLGDGTVGKTSIAMRFTNDQFGQQYKQVI